MNVTPKLAPSDVGGSLQVYGIDGIVIEYTTEPVRSALATIHSQLLIAIAAGE